MFFNLVNESKQFCFTKKATINYIILCCNCSIVAYPVGYHVDTFKQNMPSFENKICFIQSKKDIHGYGEGRGVWW